MLMSKQTINNEAATVKVATNNLATGVYLIKVISNGKMLFNEKLIVINK
jgi:hypothetical protein